MTNTTDLYAEALDKFKTLFDQARQTDLREPTAMTLATVNEQGRPVARTVLLKKADENGFMFVTNSRSRKGQHLADNPCAALVFYWQTLHRQVCVEGRVEPVSDDEINAYWNTRPRGSRLGAWASDQSQPLDSMDTLHRRVEEYQEKFADIIIPRPEHWGGYRIIPDRIEFWRGVQNRLNERTCYCKDTDGGWSRTLLNP